MKHFFWAAVIALTASPALAAPPADTDAYVAQAMRAFGVPGLSLAIVEDGRTALAKGYGVTDIAAGRKVDAHSAFPIGSESKAFTTAALAILVDRKKLAWSDLVKDRLPGFQMYDPYVTAHMTVRDLLTHRSGLGLGEGDLMLFPNTNRSRADIVHALRYLKPATGFREGYAYDNILYIVAGALVEAVSRQSWENFVTANILGPVGMGDAHTNYDRNAPNKVSLYERNSAALQGMGPQSILTRSTAQTLAPAGGINASALDLSRWMAVQLAHGKLADGRQLFSAEQAETMWRPVTIITPPEGPHRLAAFRPDMQAYALGWFVEEYRGHKIIRHTGAVGGALASLYLIPDKNVGIAVTINSEDGMGMTSVLYHLLDHYLDLPPTDWTVALGKVQQDSFAKAEAALKRNPVAGAAGTGKAALPLAAYAGRYQDPWYGDITIGVRGGGLWISFDRTPGMEGPLEPVMGDKFRTRWTDHSIEDAYMIFNRAGDGGATMAAISPLADFSFDYQDLHFRRVQ